MGQLLQDAIADAKQVRETALANAKLALEEAFAPQLQSMLDAKIRREVEGDEEELPQDDLEVGDEEIPVAPPEAPEEAPLAPEVPPTDAPVPEAPPVTEPEPGTLAPTDEKPEGEVDDLDLEAIIRELEAEAAESDLDVEEEPAYGAEEAPVEVEGKIAKDGPNLKKITPSGPDLAGNTVKPGVEVDKTTDIEQPSKSKIQMHEAADDDEEVNIDEILRELAGEEEEEEVDEAKKKEEDLEEKLKKTEEELDEHKKVVEYLSSKLNEVNLLNAKLLFSNKLFKSHTLSNAQKMKVIENFDRAKTLREVKLVYATIAESLSETEASKKKATGTAKKITEGLASKSTKATVVKEVKQKVEAVDEPLVSPASADRLKRLANIIK